MVFKTNFVIASLLLGLVAGVSARVAGAEETAAERRGRIAAMSAEQKQQLLRKQQRFAEHPPAEQERLRHLHAELNTSPDQEQLQEVLERYYAWRTTLSPAERAQLDDLPAEQRIAQIRELMNRQEEQRFRKLVQAKLLPEDRKAIFEWLTTFVDRHHESIIAALPAEHRPRDEYNDRQRYALTWAMLRRWSQEDTTKEPSEAKMPRPNATEVQDLLKSLSPQASEAMKTVKDTNVRIKVAQEWIRAAVMSRNLPVVSQEDLREFYVKELNELDREKLESLAADERQQALQRMYFENKFRRGGGPGRGRGDGGRDEGRDKDGRDKGRDGDGRGSRPPGPPGTGPGGGPSGGPGGEVPPRGGPPRDGPPGGFGGGKRSPPENAPADSPADPPADPPVDSPVDSPSSPPSE
jgi:hypothetical protein